MPESRLETDATRAVLTAVGARSAWEGPRPDYEATLVVMRRPRLNVWSRDAGVGSSRHRTFALVGSNNKRPLALRVGSRGHSRNGESVFDGQLARILDAMHMRSFHGSFLAEHSVSAIPKRRRINPQKNVAAMTRRNGGSGNGGLGALLPRAFSAFRFQRRLARLRAHRPPGALASSTPTERYNSRERRTFVPVPLTRPLHASRSNVLVHPRASSRADVNRRLGDYVSKQIRPTSVGPSPLSPPFSPPGAPAWLSSPL